MRKSRRSAKAVPQERIADLSIAEIGHRGDGIAQGESGSIYVPFTLPGETVRARVAGNRGTLDAILQESPERIAPVCRHFGTCGGCALQHWADVPYLEWKQMQVEQALRQQGIDVPVAPVVATEAAGRRRTVLAARTGKGGLQLGYHARASHDVIDIAECPVLVPRLQQAIAPLRELLRPAIGGRGGATVTLTSADTGLDVSIEGVASPDDPHALGKLAAAAATAGIVRLAMNGEILLQIADPVLDMGGASIVPPPGAFLQASREAEGALWRLVEVGIGKAQRVADLFCGCGTFALRLARNAQVLAVESDVAALAALGRAARQPGLKAITAKRRDLFAEPLLAAELKGFDAVVFDPPFAGAAAQAQELANSQVPHLAAVSCNPATFARDARILADGGYVLKNVTPVDQFVFSAHIELVGHFVKG